jgi:uncharacterized membrane protein
MKEEKKNNILWTASLIVIILGIIFIIYGYTTYYNAMCSCPAQAVGHASKPCNCINASANSEIEIGILSIILGIWWIALIYYKIILSIFYRKK